jgi:hypothetical protein
MTGHMFLYISNFDWFFGICLEALSFEVIFARARFGTLLFSKKLVTFLVFWGGEFA